jgi:hypothetical protein
MPRDSVEHPNRIGVHRAGDLDDDEDDLSALGEGVGVVPCVPSHVADARGVVEGGLVRRAALLVLLVRCLQPRVRWRALSAVPPKAMCEPSASPRWSRRRRPSSSSRAPAPGTS